jgi:hypothetical protein
MTRKEILLDHMKTVQNGADRITKFLNSHEDDFRYAVISRSMRAIAELRNIEAELTGKSRSELDEIYSLKEG